jgi:hypothetical protein
MGILETDDPPYHSDEKDQKTFNNGYDHPAYFVSLSSRIERSLLAMRVALQDQHDP